MKTSKTFTLIELILVVAIVALLAGAMIPFIRSARQNARVAKLYTLIETLKHACQMYYSDTGRLVNEEDSLGTIPQHNGLSQNDMRGPPMGSPTPGWDGPYIPKKISTDDNPFGGNIRVYAMIGPIIGSNVIVLLNVPESAARKINSELDINESGPWDTSGDVRYFSAFPVWDMVTIQFYKIKIN